MPPTTRKRPNDATGRKAEELAALHAAELEERAKEMAIITETNQQGLENTLVDYTQGPPAAPVVEVPEPGDGRVAGPDKGGLDTSGLVDHAMDQAQKPAPELEVRRAVQVREVTKTMRVNTKLEMVTYGAGRHYDFEVGPTYRVGIDLYEMLDEKGYVWH